MFRFLLKLKRAFERALPYILGCFFSFIVTLFLVYSYYGSPFEDVLKHSMTAVITLIIALSIYIFITTSSGFFPDSLLSDKTFAGISRCTRFFRKGIISMENRNLGEAISNFKEAEESAKNDEQKAVLANFIGACYKLTNYPTNAAIYFQKAIEFGMDNNDIRMDTAKCFTAAGSYNEALEHYNYLEKQDPIPDNVYNEIGLFWVKKGDGEKALEYFKKSEEKKMKYSFALGGCSIAYLLTGDFKESRRYFTLAILNNIPDLDGFKEYYVNIAESVGFNTDFTHNISEKNNDDFCSINV